MTILDYGIFSGKKPSSQHNKGSDTPLANRRFENEAGGGFRASSHNNNPQSTQSNHRFHEDVGRSVDSQDAPSAAQEQELKDFLKALGYQNGSVYIRLLPPKGFEAEHYDQYPDLSYEKDGKRIPCRLKLRMVGGKIFWITRKGESPMGDAWEFLQKKNAEGFGVYFVVNPGGHSEAEIEGSRVLFWEDDNKSKADQLATFDECQENWGGGIAVETNASIHNYFIHDAFHDPLAFSIHQLRAIAHFGSDSSIWDSPRLMRLPTFDHTKIVDGVIVRFPVRVVRPWDGEEARWWAIDDALPQPNEEMIAQATGCHSRAAVEIPLGDDPCDPRNFIKLLPHHLAKNSEWDTAAIPAPGVTSSDGFHVHKGSGRYKVWSGTVAPGQAIKAIAAYLNQVDERITHQGILDWFRGETEETPYEDVGDRPISREEWETKKLTAIDGGKTEAEPTEAEKRNSLISNRLFAFQQLKPVWERTWKLTETSDRPLTRYDGSAADFDLDLKTAKTIGIRGGLGSGKTEALVRAIVAEAKQRGFSGLVKGANALQIVILNPTNGLCRQLEGRIEAALLKVGISLPTAHFQDNVGAAREAMRDGHPGIYVMCKESFADYHMGDVDWSQTIVAIDEVSSFRQTAPGASDQLPDLIRMMTECKHLIALDRFLSDVDTKVLSLYRGSDRLLLAQNEVKEKKLIHWIESITKEGLISLSHKGVALSLLGQWVVEGVPINRIAIASDSLLELNIIKQWLIDSGCAERRILISSQTIEDSHSFMPSPDDLIREEKIHYLLYSPTAQSGLDIQEPFERGILICTGILPPTLMIQMMGRIRKCYEWWVSAPRFSQDSALSFKTLDADRLKRWEYAAENTLIRLWAAKGDRRVQAWAGINQAVREIEKKFNSECIYELLQDGYETVDKVEVAACQQWDALRDVIKDDEARKLLRGDRVHGGELLKAKRPPSLDSEVWDINAAKIYSKYPEYVGELRQDYCQWLTTQAPDNERRVTELGGIAAVESAIARLMDNELELNEAFAHAAEELDVSRRIRNESKTPETSQRLAAAKAEVQDLKSFFDQCQVELKELKELVMVSKMGDGEFVAQMRLLSSSRIEKLYEGEKARQNNEQDRANILHAIQTRFTSTASKRYQVYRNNEIFNRLDLEGLVQATSKDDWKKFGFWISGSNGSDDVLSRFETFKTAPELLQLFPEIETLEGFLEVCKRVLKGYGYESSGGTAWREVEGLHKNGNSGGKQRYTTNTKSVYCLVFIRMESSGSNLFRKLLPALMDAIGERIEREREIFKPKEADAGGRYERSPDIPKAA